MKGNIRFNEITVFQRVDELRIKKSPGGPYQIKGFGLFNPEVQTELFGYYLDQKRTTFEIDVEEVTQSIYGWVLDYQTTGDYDMILIQEVIADRPTIIVDYDAL